jgi:FAD:protein FMN transferase
MAAALVGLGFRRVAPGPGAMESLSVGGGRHKMTWSRPAMGTLVTLTAIHRSRELSEDAAGRAFQEMDRLVALLSRYESSSALSVLNREGVLRSPPPELRAVVSGALRFHAVSKGAFDPTVRPLVDLFRARMGTVGEPPAVRAPAGEADILTHPDHELLHALDLVDARKVKLRRHAIRFNRQGMGMTLDGIAKGYVVDRMAEILTRRGLEDFLIDAGGDIRSAGRREDGRPWQVAVQDPAKEGVFPDLIGLTDGAVATSGSYEICFDRDRTRHHIVSGRTGASPQQSRSVSVVAPTTLAADALATAVFVMGCRAGVALVDSLPQCACLVVDHLGRTLSSARWRSAKDLPTSKAGTP